MNIFPEWPLIPKIVSVPLVESGESFRNDKELYKQYNNFRNNYWKMRAKEYLEGK
ncbi:HNH/ENDO VII family nuclease [Streptomyces venezuelae]|uniref:HNH/ENDO VII family nuclease n=1 Tax=Bacillus paramycoides TaxID=2026194 RepID=UPI003449E050